jgi:hypothetical protein
MFCSHNEVDLTPAIVSKDGADWAVVRCTACKKLVGKKVRLVELVERAVARRQAKQEDVEG